MHIAVCILTFTLRNAFVRSYRLFMIKSGATMVLAGSIVVIPGVTWYHDYHKGGCWSCEARFIRVERAFLLSVPGNDCYLAARNSRTCCFHFAPSLLQND
jgi:hypothetical protein